MSDLPKTFDPAAIEERWYAHWESRGLFRPDRGDREAWTIVMPPPNVTGSLHIGHALDNTLQDVLTRRERMLGTDYLLPSLSDTIDLNLRLGRRTNAAIRCASLKRPHTGFNCATTERSSRQKLSQPFDTTVTSRSR